MQVGVTHGKALGADVDGVVVPVGAPVKNISQVMMLSLCEPWLIRKAGQKLVGSWIFPILFRREAFPLLHRLFADVAALPEKKPGRLSATSQEELLSMILVAPLLRHDMRWPVHDRIFAHDAEGAGGSAVVPRAASRSWREVVAVGASDGRGEDTACPLLQPCDAAVVFPAALLVLRSS